jgi:hypothetical protein
MIETTQKDNSTEYLLLHDFSDFSVFTECANSLISFSRKLSLLTRSTFLEKTQPKSEKNRQKPVKADFLNKHLTLQPSLLLIDAMSHISLLTRFTRCLEGLLRPHLCERKCIFLRIIEYMSHLCFLTFKHGHFALGYLQKFFTSIPFFRNLIRPISRSFSWRLRRRNTF